MQPGQAAYRQLCQNEYLPWYARDWWLDAVCGPESWKAATVRNRHDELVGALPLTYQRKMGLSRINTPPWTAHLHLWLREPKSQRRVYRYGQKQAVIRQLVDQLPRTRWFDQQYDPTLRNILPFHWAGYRHTTRYTYRLHDLREPARIFREMDTTTRNHIRKARAAVEMVTPDQPDELLRLLQLSFQRKGLRLPQQPQLPTLIQTLQQRARLTIYGAQAPSGQLIAAIAIVEDEHLASYWLSGADEEGLRTGSISLLLWEAIKQAARRVQTFDFEGSMIPGVETLFRSFGAERIPYYRVYRTRPRWLEFFRR